MENSVIVNSISSARAESDRARSLIMEDPLVDVRMRVFNVSKLRR